MNLFGTPLSTRLYFTLWVGLGSLVGLFLGALIATGGDAFSLTPLWLFSLAAFTGLVWWLARRNAPATAPAPARAAPAAVPTRTLRPTPAPGSVGHLRIAIDFPEVPAGYPPVIGKGEETTVRLRVTLHGKPAEGAAVRLSGTLRDGARGIHHEGVTGTGGTVAFLVRAPATGELVIAVEASMDAERGRADTTIGVVLYGEEIERLFTEFRAYAISVLGPHAHADTARELAEGLRRQADPDTGRALLELARIYELVAYGERPADRKLYLALVGALLTLEGGAPSPLDAPGATQRPRLEG